MVFRLLLLTLLGLVPTLAAPEYLGRYLRGNGEADAFIKGEYGRILSPREIIPLAQKVKYASQQHPAWFAEQIALHPDSPLPPYHENLGLTLEEYEQYLSLWKQRKFQPSKPVAIRLEENEDASWMIRVTGPGFPIQSLEFSADGQTVTSPNGTLIPEKNQRDRHGRLLGDWSGPQWSMKTAGAISTTEEYFAIGKLQNEDAGYLVYRIQETTASGRSLYDKQILIKFPIKP